MSFLTLFFVAICNDTFSFCILQKLCLCPHAQFPTLYHTCYYSTLYMCASRSVGSQLDAFVPATRLSTLRVLVAVDVNHANALLCGGPKGPGLGGRPRPKPSPSSGSSSSGSSSGSDGSSSSSLPPATDADYRRVFGDGGLHDGFARLRVMLETLLAAQVRSINL